MKSTLKLLLITLLGVVFLSACNKDDEPKEPQKSNLQKYVTVKRGVDTALNSAATSCTISFSKNGNWKVYMGTDPGNIDMTTVVGESTGDSVVIANLDPYKRYYFEVVLNGTEKATVSSRQVAIVGQPNFRDLGGFINKDGKSVKWGILFRAGELSRLTDNDKMLMTGMGLDMVIDFRYDEEINENPDIIPEGIEYLNIPVDEGSYSRAQMTQWLISSDSAAFDTLLIHANKAFAIEAQPKFYEFMSKLNDGKKIVFHCTAGKDRTGFATALILSALDVDRQTIMEDYLSSNYYNEVMIQKTIDYVNSMGLNGEILLPVLIVKESYLEEAFDIIDNKYGGMDNYLNMLGVDKEKLKSLYLE